MLVHIPIEPRVGQLFIPGLLICSVWHLIHVHICNLTSSDLVPGKLYKTLNSNTDTPTSLDSLLEEKYD